jgi:hypothetical protein
MPKNYEIRTMDCSRSKVVLVRGVQAKHLRKNLTASHLKAEFVLQGFLEGDDLHIFTTGNKEDVGNVSKVVQEAGGDFSKAVMITGDRTGTESKQPVV